MRALRLLLPFIVIAAEGCRLASHDDATPRAPVTLASGDRTLVVDVDARTIELSRGGVSLLRFDAEGLALGARDSVDDTVNYDPVGIYQPSGATPAPDDLVWLVPDRFEVASSSATSLEIDLTYPSSTKARLHVELGKSDGAFAARLVPTGPNLAYFRLRAHADEQEGFYGLGEYFDDVNQRGHVRAMQLELDGELESNYNEAHVPIPLVIGTRGWGLFVEDPHPAVFAVASEKADQVDAVFGTGTATPNGLSFHLFAEENPLDVTRHYYEVTGFPLLPARWALGPWLWRDENSDQAQFEKDLQDARDLDVATSAWWIDRPYATGVQTFDFDAKKFTDANAAIAKAHDLGFRLALWHAPYLDEKDASTQALRDEANAKGYYPKQVGLLLNKWGKPIDLTNGAAFDWWQSLVRHYTDAGIEGFKLDYGEDVVPGLAGGRNVWRFADGSDERTMHGGFQRFYHRVYAQTLPTSGGFLLCRHSTYGDQKNVSVIWPGDLDSNFAKHREHVTEGTDKYVAVGGLPASVVAGLSLGPSGFPFFGADTGGYRRAPGTKEVVARWFEQTSLSTVMQFGNDASKLPWEADATSGWDAEMAGWYKTYARLHLRLFPYEWTYAQNLAKDGRPIARPFGLMWPELGAHPNDEYAFGDYVLVAPVVEQGKTSRTVIFPSGRFVDWWTGAVQEAGTREVSAPLGTLPLYLREGGTVPMLRPTIDTLSPTTSPDVDSYAKDAGVLWARIAPGPNAAKFVLFDGATLEHQKSGGVITLKSADGSEFEKGVVFELLGAPKPTSVSDGSTPLAEVADLAALDAAASGFLWTSDGGGTLRVKLPAGTHVATVH